MKQIQLDELDFDGIKQNLKTFLQGQSQFDSYNFEGSAMSTLLDILALNTHYNAMYTNMAINESFLDSASKRSSIVSHAKSLGYIAKSTRSSRAKITVTVTLPNGETPNFLTMPKGTSFSSIVGSEQFTFSTLTDYTAPRVNGEYEFEEIEVVEGQPVTHTTTKTAGSLFVIPNKDVDTTTLRVLVQENAQSSNSTNFTFSDDYVSVRGVDAVYFLKQRDDLYFEIYFGDGAIGREVVNGNVVTTSYLTSRGADSNGANVFTYASGFRSDVGFSIATIGAASGGAAEEDNESIRYNASRAWIAQGRAVTASDYDVLLRSRNSSIEALHVWGGQDNIPKVYGKVFVSAKPYGREAFTDAEKRDMANSLIAKKGILTTIPEFVDPEFMNLELSANVYYNAAVAKKTSGELQTLVQSTIASYGSTLNKFDSIFRYSKLSSLVDATDESITSNAISLRIRVPVIQYIDVAHTYSHITDNPITVIKDGGGFWSTRFYIAEYSDRCYLKDDGLGAIYLYTENLNGQATKQGSVGTINYSAGSWSIPGLKVSSLYDSKLEFVFTPSANDVVSSRNMIVTITNNLTVVNMISDTNANGSTVNGQTFQFTPVR